MRSTSESLTLRSGLGSQAARVAGRRRRLQLDLRNRAEEVTFPFEHDLARRG
jgi:hypothetical protein